MSNESSIHKATKNSVFLQSKARVQNEKLSEEIRQHDIRYRHYLNNLDRIVFKDDNVTRQYYSCAGQMKYHT